MTDPKHLSPVEIVEIVEIVELRERVDLVEAISDADSDKLTHLASCDRCRDQLADLRATRAIVSEIEVPEPSPFFWDHLSARVRDAVAAEAAAPDRWWQHLWSWPRVLAPASALVAVILIAAVALRTSMQAPVLPGPLVAAHQENQGSSSAAPPELLGDTISTDDASLVLMADLTDGMEWDAEADAGLTPDGSAEHAITHMSATELQQLASLLKEEMSRKGA